MKKLLLNYPTTSFFVLALLWSNIIWLYVLPHFNISPTSGSDWFWLGECAPGLSAFLITWITKQKIGVINLIKPVIFWRTDAFYYYFIFIAIGCFYLAAIGVTAIQGHTILSFSSLYQKEYFGFLGMRFYGVTMIPVFTILYFFCEELGWRGFALPQLMKRYNAFTASIIIGIAWSLFHLPLMETSTLLSHPFSFFLYTLSTIMSSLVFSWVYLKTGGSLLLVSLLHAATDTYGVFSPSIISSVGQGKSTTVIILQLLFFLPVFVLLYKNRNRLKITSQHE